MHRWLVFRRCAATTAALALPPASSSFGSTRSYCSSLSGDALDACVRGVVGASFLPVSALARTVAASNPDAAEALATSHNGLLGYLQACPSEFEVSKDARGVMVARRASNGRRDSERPKAVRSGTSDAPLAASQPAPGANSRDNVPAELQVEAMAAASASSSTTTRAADCGIEDDALLRAVTPLVSSTAYVSIDGAYEELPIEVRSLMFRAHLQQFFERHTDAFVVSADGRSVCAVSSPEHRARLLAERRSERARLPSAPTPGDIAARRDERWQPPGAGARGGIEVAATDPTLGAWWASFDAAGTLLPLVPSFFVKWSDFWEVVPSAVREQIPRFQRVPRLVSKLREFCDFAYLPQTPTGSHPAKPATKEAHLRLKRGAPHPSANGALAERLYPTVRYDDAAVVALARVLPPLHDVDASLLSTLLPTGTPPPWSGKRGGMGGMLREFPLLFVTARFPSGESVVGTLSGIGDAPRYETVAESPIASAVDEILTLFAPTSSSESAAPSDGLPLTELLAALSPRSVSLISDNGGVARLLATHRALLSLDATGRVVPASHPAACPSRLGTLAQRCEGIPVASEAEVDAFTNDRIAGACSKLKRKQRIIGGRSEQSVFADPDELLRFVAKYVPLEGHIDAALLAQDITPEARAFMPNMSVLRYCREHPRVFDIQESLDGRVAKYAVRRRRGGERAVDTANPYFDDEALVALLTEYVDPARGAHTRWILINMPYSAREALRAKHGGLVNFARSYPQYFRVVRVVRDGKAAVMWLFVADAGTERRSDACLSEEASRSLTAAGSSNSAVGDGENGLDDTDGADDDGEASATADKGAQGPK